MLSPKNMPDKKWLAPILPYLAVCAGLYLFKNAWFALIGFHVAILFALVVMRLTKNGIAYAFIFLEF